ncbi:MAG: hypothetical protein HY000_07285 [Planctomycetes bacterium]|nr:hypothetical protein [Planctomycetota bacterium]
MPKLSSLIIIVFLAVTPRPGRADGLLYQLPDDGTWVRFDTEGKAFGPDGGVKVTITGSVMVSSVGQTDVYGEKCRWIEIGSTAKRGEQEFTEVYKLLIPEKRLKQGENPLDHVLKAWQKHSMINHGAPQQLDLGAVRSLDEFLSGPAPEVTKLPAELTDSKLGKRQCEGLRGHAVVKTCDSETHFTYEVRLDKDAPFGVVTFRYEKARKRQGQSLGARTATFKLADFGTEAKSALPDSQ